MSRQLKRYKFIFGGHWDLFLRVRMGTVAHLNSKNNNS